MYVCFGIVFVLSLVAFIFSLALFLFGLMPYFNLVFVYLSFLVLCCVFGVVFVVSFIVYFVSFVWLGFYIYKYLEFFLFSIAALPIQYFSVKGGSIITYFNRFSTHSSLHPYSFTIRFYFYLKINVC